VRRNIVFAVCLATVAQLSYCQSSQNDLKQNIALIAAEQSNGSVQIGAGFVVGRQGETVYLLTAKHVVSSADSVNVTFPGIPGQIEGQIFDKADDALDLAVILVSSNKVFPKLRLSDQSKFIPGMIASTIGHPRGVNWSYANLTLARLSSNDDTRVFLLNRTDRVDVGNSGGPVFDPLGALVGMITELPNRDFVKAVKIGSVLEVLREEDWSIPTNNLLPAIPDVNGSWTDGMSGHRVVIRKLGNSVSMTRYNGADEADKPQGTMSERTMKLFYPTDYGQNAGEIELTISDDGQTLKGTIGMPRAGFPPQPYILRRLGDSESVDVANSPKLVLTGRWTDGTSGPLFVFETKYLTTQVGLIESDGVQVYNVPVSVNGRVVRFSFPANNGPLDYDLRADPTGMILEGTVTNRSTGERKPCRLDRTFRGIR
jgi:S1-C subfamily serine protease